MGNIYQLLAKCILLSLCLKLCLADQNAIEKRNKKLIQMTEDGDSNVIKMSQDTYNSYIKGKSRDYTSVIMFTVTNKERGCDICLDFYEALKLTASSWNKQNGGPNKVYFFLADYDSSPEIFQTFELQGVPAVYTIPSCSKGKVKKDVMRLMSEEDLTATGIVNWLKSSAKINIKLVYPIPWVKIISTISVLIFFSVIAYFTKDKISFKMVSFRNISGIVILQIIYYFLGGAMWTRINKPPFSMRDRSGGQTYIAKGRSSQLVGETYVLMAIYSMLSLGFFIMTEAPQFKAKKLVKIGVMLLGLLLFLGFFQYLLNITEFKQASLPHKSILWWM